MNESTPDPVALAGYVLRRHEALLESNDRDEILDIFEDFAAFAPALARAALAVCRVEELADRLEREADVLSDSRSGLAVHAGSVKARTVTRIRAALREADR